MQPLKVEPGVGKPVDGENIGDSTFIFGIIVSCSRFYNIFSYLFSLFFAHSCDCVVKVK